MGQALYRKYRSKSLDTVVGQEHITSTLANALKTGKISHAYLFTGPRGVGKTSIARILAHAVNDLPYDDESTHLDIIEIDAASNRRIDEIRELRDKVHIAPTSAKYKVYIIDEVHMLTKEAFNALLKTLEEPPAHAVFILATTEIHKLPETIVSRTQRYTFKPVAQEQVVAHLRSLAEQEGISITDEALGLIARHGEGSFRDSISLLDQTRGYEGEVSLSTVQGMLGMPPEEAVDELWQAAAAADAAAVARHLQAMGERGYEASQIARLLGRRLRTDIIGGQGDPARLRLLRELVDTPAAFDPAAQLEITMLGYALRDAPAAMPVAPRVVQAPVAAPQPITAPLPPRPEPKPAPRPETAKEPEPAPAPPPDTVVEAQAVAAPIAGSGTLDESAWPQILGTLKKTHNTLYSVLRSGEPVFEAGKLTVKVKFKFHQKRLSDAKNQEVIVGAIQTATGQTVAFACILDEAAQAPDVAPVASAGGGGGLAAISNVFGGGEVL